MTSTTTGLPDRYRPLDEVGTAETTATGVIRCWRAKDRVLNRDVAIRVHTPGGPAARDWISRALTAGGLATPALAMVYDAAEGSGDPRVPGGAAYVVNEWIEGRTLAERLAEGPMPEHEARTVLRRLAEGVAEAHRVGLAVGGLSPESVVLRPNGLVGLRAVPAASGTMQGDVAALGELLEYCLTGHRSGGPPTRGASAMAPDLAALVRRARSTEPGAGLSSVAAMAALLAERPRTGAGAELVRGDESDSGWLRRLRERRDDDPEVDPTPTVGASGHRGPPPPPPPPPAARPASGVRVGGRESDLLPLSSAAAGGSGNFVAEDRSAGSHAAGSHVHGDRVDGGFSEEGGSASGGLSESRRRLLVMGMPLLALALVVAVAWWLGASVLSVADSVTVDAGAVPSAPTTEPPAEEEPAAGGAPIAITGATVFDPFGDGEPENDHAVPLSYDGDPATAWSTVEYRGSPNFGNLKPGVGVVYDLGSEQALAGATLATTTPGATMEVRTGGDPTGPLDSFGVVASGEVEGTTEFSFAEPVTTRYLLIWITGLVPSGGGFSADVAEVTPQPAG